MVGDRAGMGTTMWYGRSEEEDMLRRIIGCEEDTKHLYPDTEEKVRATAAEVAAGNRCLDKAAAAGEAAEAEAE